MCWFKIVYEKIYYFITNNDSYDHSNSSSKQHQIIEYDKKANLNWLILEREFIFEEVIGGREFTVTIIGNQCYPAIEIKTKKDFYDYFSLKTRTMMQM